MAKPWKIVDLDPGENLKVCLRKIAQTRFQETFSYEQGAIDGEDIEALHDMRVSARRLRAVLRIFRECFPKKKFRKQDEKLQTLIRSLGAVREQDVFIEMLVNYRKTLRPQEGKVVDLMLAREQTSWSVPRRLMLRNLRLLRHPNYADSFNQFLKDSL
jgi:CHAD domain-containing protein